MFPVNLYQLIYVSWIEFGGWIYKWILTILTLPLFVFFWVFLTSFWFCRQVGHNGTDLDVVKKIFAK